MLLIAPQLAHSPTSLLSLPNDILLLIFEQAYGSPFEFEFYPFPIREIIINKRIYTLLQSLCFSHLIINKKQLDCRVAGLLNDTIDINRSRRESLRSLDVHLTNSFFNLVTSLIACLPKLSTLSLDLSEGINSTAVEASADAIASKSTLHELQLKCPALRPIDIFYKRYISKKPDHTISITAKHHLSLIWTRKSENGILRKTHLCTEEAISGLQIDWSKLLSLSLESSEESPLWVSTILAGLRQAIVSFAFTPSEED